MSERLGCNAKLADRTQTCLVKRLRERAQRAFVRRLTSSRVVFPPFCTRHKTIAPLCGCTPYVLTGCRQYAPFYAGDTVIWSHKTTCFSFSLLFIETVPNRKTAKFVFPIICHHCASAPKCRALAQPEGRLQNFSLVAGTHVVQPPYRQAWAILSVFIV